MLVVEVAALTKTLTVPALVEQAAAVQVQALTIMVLLAQQTQVVAAEPQVLIFLVPCCMPQVVMVALVLSSFVTQVHK
jgi:hypothetical protein